jgi:hypothetical protein
MAVRWPFTRAYEVAKLERDAVYVCEDAERRFPSDQVRALAGALQALLEEAAHRRERPNMTRGNVLAELRSRHREARRQRRDRELSELTLAIIRVKAEELDAEGAIEAIDRFLERWPPAGVPAEPERPEH